MISKSLENLEYSNHQLSRIPVFGDIDYSRYAGKHGKCPNLSPDTPRVVKFSGGRSSGMLLFILLQSGLLKASRGDVVLFNNTSAEHPKTYNFVAKCKDVVEGGFGIPFFWTEFQTYEDARGSAGGSEWGRFRSYRLVNHRPYSENNPGGYRRGGEVFEEMLSYAGYAPNQFSRICTKIMKLDVTMAFLKDWFLCREKIDSLGHNYPESRLTDDAVYAAHEQHSGGVPRDIFLDKKRYLRSCALTRREQQYADYSSVFKRVESPYLISRRGAKIGWLKDEIQYVSFVGIRHDEPKRVARVKSLRSCNAGEYDAEYISMPLDKLKVTKEDVNKFWKNQDWLGLPHDADLSNCVYCFLKGARKLHGVHQAMKALKPNGSKCAIVGTPSDVEWWAKMEEKYSRDLLAERRDTSFQGEDAFIGFFGRSGKFSYRALAGGCAHEACSANVHAELPPCECTD